MNAATTIQPQADELARCLTAAREAGMAREQISRFLKAGYVPQPKQMQLHAAAQHADHSLGPTLIAIRGARGPGKSHASIEQAAVDDCQRIPGQKVLSLRKVARRGIEPDTRFIPANYKDNKSLNKEYIVYLLTLTGVLGRMRRDGDWDVGAGTTGT